jgi:hypothetical protein
MAQSKHDRLLAALIGKLPAEKTQWRRDDRIAWLWMMALAFDVVYGPCGGIRIASDEDAAIADAPSQAAISPPDAQNETISVPTRFYVDRDGFAMGDGRPLALDDLPAYATLWDERTGGEAGDIATILWRDVGTTRRNLPLGVMLKPALNVA